MQIIREVTAEELDDYKVKNGFSEMKWNQITYNLEKVLGLHTILKIRRMFINI